MDLAFNQFPKLLARLKRRQGDNSYHSNSGQRSPVDTDTTAAVRQEENGAHNTAPGRATQDSAEADPADTSSSTSKEGEGSGGGDDSDEEVHRTEQPLATSNMNLIDLAQVRPGHVRHAQITSDPLFMILEYALMAENSLSLIDLCKESYPLGTLYTCQTFWTLGSATFFSSNVFKLQVDPAGTTYSANADKIILVCYDTIVRFKDEYKGCLPLKLALEDLDVEGKLNPGSDRKIQKVIAFPRAAYFGVDVLQRLRHIELVIVPPHASQNMIGLKKPAGRRVDGDNPHDPAVHFMREVLGVTDVELLKEIIRQKNAEYDEAKAPFEAAVEERRKKLLLGDLEASLRPLTVFRQMGNL